MYLTLCAASFGQPANDNFANAITIPQSISDGGVGYAGDNSTATAEPGEPAHTAGAAGKSLWWQWTAPVNGVLSFQMFPAFDAVMAVYQGNAVSNLTLVVSHPGFPWPFYSFGVRVRAGTTYRIAVDSFNGTAGTFNFVTYFSPAPDNDDFAARFTVSGLPVAEPITFLRAATREPGEPAHPQEVGERTLWWTWTAPESGVIGARISWQYHAGIAFYTGDSVSNLTLVDGGAIGNAGMFPFRVHAGTNYQIVTYPGADDTDHITLQLEPGVIPANDLFAGALPLAGTNISVSASNTFAFTETNEPAAFPDASGKTLWWSWTAPASGILDFKASGNGPFGVAAYRGESLAALQLVAVNSNAAPHTDLSVTAGTTYFFAADGLDGNYGDFDLHLVLTPTPANDAFAGRAVLTGTTAFDFALGDAGAEPGDPVLTNGGSRTLWWTFTPDGPGVIRFRATSLGTAAVVGVGIFQGTSLGSLAPAGAGDGEVTLRVQAGVPYQILVAVGPDATAGRVYAVHVDFRFDATEDNDFFANRTQLSGSSLTLIDNNFGATAESGEPKHNSLGTTRHSVWYTWTAPDTGSVYLRVHDAEFVPAVAVYEGTSLKKLRPVARTAIIFRDNYYEVQNVLSFPAVAGRVYQIAVDVVSSTGLLDGGAPGEFALDLEFTTLRLTSPANGLVFRSEAPPLFAVNPPNPAVDGPLASVTFQLAHEDHVTGIEKTVFAAPFAFTPTNVPPGHYVALAIGTNQSGRVIVSPPIQITAAPPGDNFSNAVPIPGFQSHVTGTLLASSLQKGEPAHSGKRVIGSVWYTWTAPESGPVNLAGGFAESTRVDIFTGAGKPSKRVAVTQPLPWIYNFTAVAGTRYWIAVFQQQMPSGLFGDFFEFDFALRALALTSPTNGAAVLNTDTIPFRVTTGMAANEILSVEYLVDDVVVGSNTVAPFALDVAGLRPGVRALKARAWLTSGLNADSAVVSLNVLLVNDHFTNAIALSGTNFTVPASTYGATREIGEIDHGVSDPNRTAWWTWTAPETGRVWIDFAGAGSNPVLRVYTGTNFASLAFADVVNRGTPWHLELQAVAGTTYRIAMVSSVELEGTLSLHYLRPPANDLFSNRTVVAGTNLTLQSTLLMAGEEPGEPVPPYGCGYTGRSVWWSWTAPAEGYVTIDARMFDPIGCLRLGVYTGTVLTNLAVVTTGEDNTAVFQTDAGQTYQIQLDISGETDPVRAQLTFTPSPVNDYFSNRLTVVGAPFLIDTPLFGARREPGEPPHEDYFNSHSVWYTWTAPASGNVHVTCSNEVAAVAVYTGGALDALQAVPVSWNPQIFHVDAGTNYQIAIGGFGIGAGPVQAWFEIVPDAPLTPRVSSGAAISVTPPVNLRINLEGGQVVLRWPATATGMTLESAASLDGDWQPVANDVVVEGADNVVSLAPESTQRFFRLRPPP